MTTHEPLEYVFGGALFTRPDQASRQDADNILTALKDHNITTIDTARYYGESEKMLGSLNAHGRGFTIDSKSPGGLFAGESLQPETLHHDAHESLQRLQLEGRGSLDVYYVHAPDTTLKANVWMPVMDKLHKEGLFKRLGLSNFKAPEVQEVYDFAEAHGLIKPSVYQGGYNAVGRLYDETLFPTLRKLGISFYAYSPIAGGFLTKTLADIEAEAGRFRKGSRIGDLYITMYSGKQSMREALEKWGQIAERAGIPKGELAYRWITYHSALSPEYGDKVITGAKNVEQLETTMSWVEKGPLDAQSVTEIEEVWLHVKSDALLDNFDVLQALDGKK